MWHGLGSYTLHKGSRRTKCGGKREDQEELGLERNLSACLPCWLLLGCCCLAAESYKSAADIEAGGADCSIMRAAVTRWQAHDHDMRWNCIGASLHRRPWSCPLGSLPSWCRNAGKSYCGSHSQEADKGAAESKRSTWLPLPLERTMSSDLCLGGWGGGGGKCGAATVNASHRALSSKAAGIEVPHDRQARVADAR